MSVIAGVGVGLRREHYDQLPTTARRIDWLEITPENYMDQGGRTIAALEACRSRWTIAAHGVAMNLGGPTPLDDDYFVALGALVDRFELAGVTEHLCYSIAGGRNYADLLPLPFSEEALFWVADRVKQAQDRLGRRLLLENISYYAQMPGSTLSEAELIAGVLAESGAGLLLDINNVFVNARNFGRPPLEVLDALPLELTGQIHLAGHKQRGEMLVDDHGSPVCDEVWSLFRRALERTGPVPVLIEWDTNVPALDRLLDEADRARQIWLECRARSEPELEVCP